jgi:hypothetical protein
MKDKKDLPESERRKFTDAEHIDIETPFGFFYHRDDDPSLRYIKKDPENVRGWYPGHRPKTN